MNSRRDDVDRAREIFEKSIQRTDLDWPEAIYEAFIQLEVVHGSPQTLQDTIKKIEKEQEKLAKRREKAAAEASAYQEQYTTAAIHGAVTGAVDAVMGDGEPKGADPTQEATDLAAAAAANILAVPAAVVQSGKDNTEEVHLKRDREHTTILLNGLPKGCTPERIENFFFEVSHCTNVLMFLRNSPESVVWSCARDDHPRRRGCHARFCAGRVQESRSYS